MSDEILLYLVLCGMLFLAVGMILPALLRIGRATEPVRDDEAYGEAVLEVFRRQLAALDEDLRTGAISRARWEELTDDLRRRMLEEHDAVCHDPKGPEAAPACGRVSGALVTGLVVAGMAAVSVGLYAANGAPELLELEKAQHVHSGQAATPDIERYLEKSPEDGRAWVLLAHRHVEAEAYPKALDAYRRARSVNAKVAEDPTVMLELAATLVTVGGHENFREAQPLVTRALEKLPGDKRALELLALTASANRDWKTAADTLALLLEGMSPDTPAYLRYEQTLKRLRELAERSEPKS